MSQYTDLVLSGMGIPEYSARGLSQSLVPINQSTRLARTVNGVLLDVSDPIFQKYASVISCSDQEPPALDGIWPGLVLTVDCVVELSYPSPDEETGTGGTETETEAVEGRTVVPGSLRTSEGFTFYRPRLTMRVVSFSVNRNEWGAVVDWSLGLEEV